MIKYIIELPEEAECELNGLIDKYCGCITKRPQNAGLGNHCKDCAYLDLREKSSVGYTCNRPMHVWRRNSTRYKQKSTQACSAFVKRDVRQ